MHGNVWEWCGDVYGKYPSAGGRPDASAPGQGKDRVARGGSWDDIAVFCRSACRFCFAATERLSRVGFRVCFCPG
jgi:formylglycine-generating enzyme required for sulfatase activity